MALSISFHGLRPFDVHGRAVDAIGPQIGDAVTVNANATFMQEGLYRVLATADHTVRFGPSNLADATGGEVWKSGDKEVRYLGANTKVFIA